MTVNELYLVLDLVKAADFAYKFSIGLIVGFLITIVALFFISFDLKK